MEERKFRAMTEETKLECALWNAKREILVFIESEAQFSKEFRAEEMDEEQLKYYLSALELLGKEVLEYGILPDERKYGSPWD